MKKIIVIGCPGSGKSVFSRTLSKQTGIPLFHLDRIYWRADKTTVEKRLFHDLLLEIMAGEEWIIDGNYASTMELRLSACDTVYFLDYPTDVCLAGVRERRGKPRADMPWIEMEEDVEFTRIIESFNESSRPQIYELLQKFNDKRIVIFSNREQANAYLAEGIEIQ